MSGKKKPMIREALLGEGEAVCDYCSTVDRSENFLEIRSPSSDSVRHMCRDCFGAKGKR